jgi:hypothetical protein
VVVQLGETPMSIRCVLLNLCVAITYVVPGFADDAQVFLAGAAAVDITPLELPVIINGSFHERQADRCQDRLHARALVLDDGSTKLAILVVDSLMMPRSLLDDVKQRAAAATGIAADHMLISATHTHSAPAVMGCLGSRADEAYRGWLPDQLLKAIVLAAGRRVPARIGWAVVEAPLHNHCRRWIFRPDRMQQDPFGEKTVRAHMHPGYQSSHHIGPAGPADTDLSLLSVQTDDGRPLAVLANYAMHYFGATPVSGDFCGRFGDQLAAQIGAEGADPTFVGIMSQGTSGDSMWMDYSRPAPSRNLDAYAAAVAKVANSAYQTIAYHKWVSLAAAQTTLRLARRTPDRDRLAWARQIADPLEGQLPQGQAQIYAREQLFLDEEPEVELVLQAMRIGQLGITALPNEVYGITGLKLKAQSPLEPTFNIELANGAQGYIPPPEQHVLGGYTTWPARTAGLEVQAEPKIVATLLNLLEDVAGRPRRIPRDRADAYSTAVMESKPIAYWRLNELKGPKAVDFTGATMARYEPGVAFFLVGPRGSGLAPGPRGNRSAHFAGGRLRCQIDEVGDCYSVEFWFWNGLPQEARAVTAYLFSRGEDAVAGAPGDHLGIGGTYREDLAGRMIFFNGNSLGDLLVGQTPLATKTWYHVVLLRQQNRLTVYLNGRPTPELDGEIQPGCAADVSQFFLGGRSDNLFNLEGKLDEIAIYDRPLSSDEIAAHYQAAGLEERLTE